MSFTDGAEYGPCKEPKIVPTAVAFRCKNHVHAERRLKCISSEEGFYPRLCGVLSVLPTQRKSDRNAITCVRPAQSGRLTRRKESVTSVSSLHVFSLCRCGERGVGGSGPLNPEIATLPSTASLDSHTLRHRALVFALFHFIAFGAVFSLESTAWSEVGSSQEKP